MTHHSAPDELSRLLDTASAPPAPPLDRLSAGLEAAMREQDRKRRPVGRTWGAALAASCLVALGAGLMWQNVLTTPPDTQTFSDADSFASELLGETELAEVQTTEISDWP